MQLLILQIEELVGLPQDGVLVCGDSGNDIELFAVPDVRGCMVSNAHPELRQWCDAHASPNLFQVCELNKTELTISTETLILAPASRDSQSNCRSGPVSPAFARNYD